MDSILYRMLGVVQIKKGEVPYSANPNSFRSVVDPKTAFLEAWKEAFVTHREATALRAQYDDENDWIKSLRSVGLVTGIIGGLTFGLGMWTIAAVGFPAYWIIFARPQDVNKQRGHASYLKRQAKYLCETYRKWYVDINEQNMEEETYRTIVIKNFAATDTMREYQMTHHLFPAKFDRIEAANDFDKQIPQFKKE